MHRFDPTQEQRDDICQRYRSGARTVDLANEFGIERQTLLRRLHEWDEPMSHGPRIKTPANERVFSDLDNAETRYWLGWVFGKAGVNRQNPRQDPALSFDVRECDGGHVGSFLDFVGATNTLSKRKVAGHFMEGRKLKASFRYLTTVRSAKMVDDLSKIGFSWTIADRLIPDQFIDDPDVWRGRFDARGRILPHSQQLTMSGHRPILRQFFDYAMRITAAVRTGTGPAPSFAGDKEVCEVTVSGLPGAVLCKTLYDMDGPAMPRKAERARIWLDGKTW